MEITICLGSSCHLKGCNNILKTLQILVRDNGLSDKVDINGTFCTGNCVAGVCVTIDDELYSVTPETTEQFFNENVLARFK